LAVETPALFLQRAAVAQLVEQLICNHQVEGSNPFCGTISLFYEKPSSFLLLLANASGGSTAFCVPFSRTQQRD